MIVWTIRDIIGLAVAVIFAALLAFVWLMMKLDEWKAAKKAKKTRKP